MQSSSCQILEEMTITLALHSYCLDLSLKFLSSSARTGEKPDLSEGFVCWVWWEIISAQPPRMGYDSDGCYTSSSDSEKYIDRELWREFEDCVVEEFLSNTEMEARGFKAAFGQNKNSYNRVERNFQRGNSSAGKKRQGEFQSVQKVDDTQDGDDDFEYNQENFEDDEEFEIVPPSWNVQLAAIGYDKNRIECPNADVQSLLCCIKNPKVHEIILEKEAIRTPEQISAVTHLGFSEWLLLLPKINKLSEDYDEVWAFITALYDGLPKTIYECTIAEDVAAKDFILGVTALEDANELTNQFEEEKESIRLGIHAANSSDPAEVDDPFGSVLLTEEDKAALGPSRATKNNNNEMDFKMTLRNCSKFPIITSRLVENQGLLCNQAIWRTKNFGALAPISEEAWRILGDISGDVARDAKARTYRMERMKNTKVKLEVTNRFFDKKCTKSDLLLLAQKGHMAYLNIIRDDFYLKRIWRTMCPYFKCICEDKNKGRSNKQYKRNPNACGESMIWFDQAVWYMLNNLNVLYPNMSFAGQMVAFRNCLKTTLRAGVAAFIGYLEIRKIMIEMTMVMVNDPKGDLKLSFPHAPAVDLIEKTLKNIEFLRDSYSSASNSTFRSGKQSYSSKSSASKVTINEPPRITKLLATPCMSLNSDAGNIETIGTPGNVGHSTTKDKKKGELGKRNNTAQTLAFE